MLTFKLAWRNLFRNVRRTVLTCILISSALIVLILTDGLTLGMIDVMVSGITKTLAGEAQINRKGFRDNLGSEYKLEDADTITDELQAQMLEEPVREVKLRLPVAVGSMGGAYGDEVA